MKRVSLILTMALVVGAATVQYGAAANNPHAWRSIGPSSIDGGESGYGWSAGRVSDLLISDDGALWIATANGGIWFRGPHDGAWTPSNNGLSTLAFGSIAHYRDAFYAASGEDHNCIDCAPGRGIFKSTDGGHTWTSLPSANTGTARAAFIRVGSADGRVLWLGGEFGLLRSSNGGEKWTLVTHLDSNGHPVTFANPSAIAVLPDFHAVLVADDLGIYRTVDDDGANWTQLNINPIADLQKYYSGTHILTSLAVTQSNPQEVLASFAISNTNYNYGCAAGLYRSLDSGSTWKQVDVDDYFRLINFYRHEDSASCQGWYDNAIAISPTEPSRFAVGGITIMETKDAASWVNLARVARTHPDVHALVYDKIGNLFVAEDGGVVEYPQGQSPLNLAQGLSITQFYNGGSALPDGSLVVAGSQDNGTNIIIDPVQSQGTQPSPCPSASPSPGSSWPAFGWKSILGGDGGYAIINPANPRQIYAEYPRGDLQSSTDGGCTWTSIAPPIKNAGWVMPYATTDDWNTIVAGANDVYITSTGGQGSLAAAGSDAWSALGAWPAPDQSKEVVTALWVSHDGSSIVAGRTDGGLAKRLHNSQWRRQLFDGSIDSIVADPNDLQRAFVSTEDSNTGFCNVQQTMNFTDDAPRWTSITSNLEDNCLQSTLALHNGMLYMGTSRGVYVYRLTPSPAHWYRVGEDLPIVPVVGLLFVNPNSLIVLTHGRGAWYLPSITR